MAIGSEIFEGPCWLGHKTIPGHGMHTSSSHEYTSPIALQEPYHPALQALVVSYSPPLLNAITSDDSLFRAVFSNVTLLSDVKID